MLYLNIFLAVGVTDGGKRNFIRLSEVILHA
jgi:hypothetical protein